MKTILQAIALVLLCTMSSFQLQAQTELSIDSPQVDIDFSLSQADQSKIKLIPQEAVAVPQPLVMKHPKNGKCYAFRCQPEAGCENCVLLWRDSNEDDKINPRQELRCRCKSDAEKSCRVRAREVECKE